MSVPPRHPQELSRNLGLRMHASRPLFVLSLCLAVLASPLCAQRGGGGGGGGRGGGGGGGGGAGGGRAAAGNPNQNQNRQAARRSDATYDRVGSWFTEVRIEGEPAVVDPEAKKKDYVGALPWVAKAKEEKTRSLVYVYDPTSDADAHTAFEMAMFQDEIGIATKLFVCARLDITAASAKLLLERYREEAPLFVAYDDEGVEVGVVSMSGYKASPKKLETLLAKAVGKDVEGGLSGFVRSYGDVCKDLEELEKKRTELEAGEDKVDRADKQKQAEIARERKALDNEEQKLLVQEREVLEAAKPPARPSGAVRLGGRGGAQRARGGRGAGGAAPGGAAPAGGEGGEGGAGGGAAPAGDGGAGGAPRRGRNGG